MISSKISNSLPEHPEQGLGFDREPRTRNQHKKRAKKTAKLFARIAKGKGDSLVERAFGIPEFRIDFNDSIKFLGKYLNCKESQKNFAKEEIAAALFCVATQDIISEQRNFLARSVLTNFATFGAETELVIATTFFLHLSVRSHCSASILAQLQGLSENKSQAFFGYQTMLAIESPGETDFFNLKITDDLNFFELRKQLLQNANFLTFGNKIPWQADKNRSAVPDIVESDTFIKKQTRSSISALIKHVTDVDPFIRDLVLGLTLYPNTYLMIETMDELLKYRKSCLLNPEPEKLVSFKIIAKFFEQFKEKDEVFREYYNSIHNGPEIYEKIILPLVDKLAKVPNPPPTDGKLPPKKRMSPPKSKKDAPTTIVVSAKAANA